MVTDSATATAWATGQKTSRPSTPVTRVSSAAGLKSAGNGKLLGLFSNEEMFQQRAEGQGDMYSPVVDLATMTSKALNTLDKNKKGFFLMVEEEGVDEFAHSNNGGRVLQSIQQLEKAVAVARAYQATHPDTLLVVTADHETGGLAVEENHANDESGTGISAEDGPFPIQGSDRTFTIDWATSGHTSVHVPVTAAGPRELACSGVAYPHGQLGDWLPGLSVTVVQRGSIWPSHAS